ncbi:MAG: threonine/serine dehydratase [Candidatus Bathyarchaeia archaeon]|jgi:threonine dehydratase
MNTPPVTLSAIQEAKVRIVNVAYRTPLYFSPRLSALTNAKVYLKLESYQPIRVFKIRGAANKILKLNPDERKRGLIAASSGNHGLAVSYLAKLTETHATIVVPTNAVQEKVKAIEEYGATVVKYGFFHDERFEKALEIQKATGAVLIPPFDDPDVIAGQGTAGLEICEDLPEANMVIVPIGGGGLISGISTAVKSLKPGVKVLGVEPEKASSMYQSLRNGKITRLSDTTSIADGLAAREPGSLTYEIVKRNVDDIVLVSEEQIEKAVFTTMNECHLVVEPSAAAAVAALLEKVHPRAGEKIVVVISGGNVSLKTLAAVLSKYG